MGRTDFQGYLPQTTCMHIMCITSCNHLWHIYIHVRYYYDTHAWFYLAPVYLASYILYQASYVEFQLTVMKH